MTTPLSWASAKIGIPGSGPSDESTDRPRLEKICPPTPSPIVSPATRFCCEPSETISTPAMPLAEITLPGPTTFPWELLMKTPRSRFETGSVPEASVPIRLPATTLPLPRNWPLFCLMPEISTPTRIAG